MKTPGSICTTIWFHAQQLVHKKQHGLVEPEEAISQVNPILYSKELLLAIV